MSIQTKGKQATKGQKQIHQENVDTVKWYTMMSAGCSMIYSAAMLLYFHDSFTWHYWLWLFISGGAQLISLYLMRLMATPTFSASGALLDGGTDVNMQGGFGEHLKDVIICSSAVQVLSLISGWFTVLWLFVPGRAFYILWVNILAPWIFQQPSEAEEAAQSKKQQKLDRRMKRSRI